ncbi:MAG: helix-turn-helix domain-containing protein [Paraprevotella clara]|nr:helix-turn-helix domain-containing protein [Paraprevotella clara]MBD9175061.1 helix-turn-helix domain-containing protein [Paraprevotella clara]
MGTDVGLFRLDHETMRLSMPYDLRGVVSAIYRDIQGKLWVGMDNRVYRFSADGSQMEETYDGLPCQRVNNFYADKTNGVYALLNGKLMKRGADRKFNEVMLSQPVNPMAMAKDASGGLWIATWDKGVVHYDAATGKITEQPVTRTTRDKDCCLSMLIDSRHGLMWVTTQDNLWVYRISGQELLPYETTHFLPEGNKILDILYEDREGNIWVSGFTPTTFVVSSNKTQVKRMEVNAMRDLTGYPLLPDRMIINGADYWIHQGRVGLMHYNSKTRQLKTVGNGAYGKCIEPDKSGQGLWAARGNSLVRLVHNQGIKETPVAELTETITHIADNGKGILHIGTDGGLYEYSLTGKRTKKLCGTQAPVEDIALCGDQLYFIARQKGLFKIPTKGGTPSYLAMSPFLSALSANADGTVWTVGKDGNVHSLRHDTLSRDGMMSNSGEVFIDVMCDRRGHVWILSNQRVREYNPENQAFRTIRTTDSPINVSLFYHLEEMQGDSIGIDGTGAICIAPSSPELDRQSFSGQMPRVTAFLYGDSLSIVDSRTDRIDIPAGSGTVSLYLSTFDIFNADKICFAYRIEGINQDWIYLPQGVNTLYINNLTKGNHKLHLRSTDGSGCWKEGESVILLHRQSFWWQEWWAVFLLTATAAVPLYCLWLVSTRVHKLRQIQRQRQDLALREIAVPSQQELIAEKDKEFLALAKNHVEQHITDPQYNVEGLASDLCMSRSNLLRRIQSLTGLSPVEFIRDIRLKHAAKMISEHPRLAMSEVAQRVGFATPSYFAKCFKKRFGILPTQYANRRNTEDNARNAEF